VCEEASVRGLGFCATLALCALSSIAGAQSSIDDARRRGMICGPDAFSDYYGRVANATLANKMMAATGTRTIRWVRPGSVISMDIRAERLTVELDDRDRITRASCS
jgi:hypothetical protein